LEPEQIEALESRFASRDVLVTLPTGVESVLFGTFHLEPDCERVSDFADQQHRPRTIH